jgi:uncharacterized protein (TIRG00374 family)
LIVAAALLVGTIGIRAVRWSVILHSAEPLNRWHLFGALNVGYFLNNILPLQVGDIGRAYLASELEGVSLSRTLSTIAVERVVDVLTLVLLLVILALFIDIPSEARAPTLVLAVVALVALCTLVVMAAQKSRALRQIERLIGLMPLRLRPILRHIATNVMDGFVVLSDARTSGRLAALSLVLWLSVGLVDYAVIRAFDLSLGYGPALLIVIATTFGFFIPSSPGSFGIYHAIVIALLTEVYDIEKPIAIGFALVTHLVFYLPPMVLGPLFLWTQQELWRAANPWAKLKQLTELSSRPS